MAAPQSEEARELALVDKVELRIALANTDAKLEGLLKTFLAPLLLKLSSEHKSVREKVISVCAHLKNRIVNIKLPVEALVKQLKDNAKNPLLSLYDVRFAQQGLPLLSAQERGELFPLLASGFATYFGDAAPQGSAILSLLLRCMLNYRFPEKHSDESAQLKTKLQVSDDDAQHLVMWFGKILLLRPSVASAANVTNYPGMNDCEYGTLSTVFKVGNAPNGSPPNSPNVTDSKIAIANSLSTGLFSLEQRVLPAIYAAADADSRISDVGEEILKRTLPEILPLSPDLVELLYGSYFGNNFALIPVRPPIRSKILNVLSKSLSSLEHPDKIAKLVQKDIGDGIDAELADRETLKLQQEIVAFIHFACHNMDKTRLDSIRRPAMDNLQSLISRQLNNRHSLEEVALRGRCYELIGLLFDATTPNSDDGDVSMHNVSHPFGRVEWLFDALTEETDKNVAVSIDLGLSHALASFSRQVLTRETEEYLSNFLLSRLKQATLSGTTNGASESSQAALDRNARTVYSAVLRFANRCLPYSNHVGRFIDLFILGISDSHELVEEAKRGLDIYRYFMLQESAFPSETSQAAKSEMEKRCTFPDFTTLVHYIFTTQEALTTKGRILPFAVSYCWQALLWAALRANAAAPEITSDWERKLEAAGGEDPTVRDLVRSELGKVFAETQSNGNPVSQLWIAAKTGVTSDRVEDSVKCVSLIFELSTLGPTPFVATVASSYAFLRPAIQSNDSTIRRYACHSFGLLASHGSIQDGLIQKALEQLLQESQNWKSAMGAASNQVQGALLASSYLLSRRRFRAPNSQLVATAREKLVPLLQEIILKSSDASLLNTVFLSISQLSMYFVLNPQDFSVGEDKLKLLELIMEQAKKGNEPAILALGHLSLVVEEESQKEIIEKLEDYFHDLHEIRQAETQFAVGEGLTILAAGWSSKAMSTKFDLLDETAPKGLARSQTCKSVVDRVLSDIKNTKPALKKASVIWAMSLVQFCASNEDIQSHLRDFQNAFKRCLSDRDELVQEAASRGLGLVYKAGSRDLKDDLVRDLIGSFSSNKADISGTVSEDTQLFEPGTLPTGDGSVSTYKDIMSLAAEVGDSSLVYRFMSLASSNAIWSSRAAFGRFGLSEVFSDSSVDGYLASNPKLYPKLFRYRFDPNQNVRRAMNDIWKALIRDSAATLNENFDSIMEDLLKTILDREWRVRQAACSAIADLVQGRKLEQVQPYTDRIWSLGFKVLDDIKASVRTAAAGLARVMTNILLRTVETSDSPKAAREQLKSVLPFLMSPSGLESTSEDVQLHSLSTLIDIIKKAQAETIRPFVPGLVEQLLALLSSFGQEKLDYVRMNAANFKISESEVDDIRLSAVRRSPLMEAIERCLDALDDETLKALIPRIEAAMKAALGMPTKVGCSRLLVSLSVRKSFLFRPFSGQFLALLEKFVRDRNETVSSSYAASMGYLARGASDEQVVRTAKFTEKLYFGDEERDRHTAGEIVQAVAKHAHDRFSAVAASFLPLVYFARNDENEDTKQIFQETWTENTGGPRAASLYLKEILALVNAHLESKRWNVKHAAALSLADAVQAIADTKGSISDPEVELVWPALKKALAEKSWDGKRRVIEQGFVTFVERGYTAWSTKSDIYAELDKIALREAKRRNREYKPAAIQALGKLAKVKQDLAFSKQAILVLKEALAEEAEEHEAEGEEGEKTTTGNNGIASTSAKVANTRSSLRERICVASTAALFQAIFPSDRVCAGQDYPAAVADVLDALRHTYIPTTTTTTTSGSTTNTLSTLAHSTSARLSLYNCSRVHLDEARAIPNIAQRQQQQAEASGAAASTPHALRRTFADLLLADSPIAMPDTVRAARAEAILALAKLCHLSGDGACLDGFKIVALVAEEKSPSIRTTLEQARIEATSN